MFLSKGGRLWGDVLITAQCTVFVYYFASLTFSISMNRLYLFYVFAFGLSVLLSIHLLSKHFECVEVKEKVKEKNLEGDENCPFYQEKNRIMQAVVISTVAGSGAKSAVKDITNTLFYWGIPYVKGYGIAVQAMSWEQVSHKKKAKINEEIVKLAGSIRKAKVHAGIKTRFIFNMMRMMQLNDMGSSKIEKEYWKEKGWLDKKRPWK